MSNNIVSEVWSKSKLVFKVLIIGLIILLLLIPMNSVENLVREREQRQLEAINEISGKWAGAQTLNGPVLVIPYWHSSPEANNRIVVSKKLAYFLPLDVRINSTLHPKEKHRGIYKVMLYAADIHVTAKFAPPDFNALRIRAEDMIWNESFIRFNISDLNGLNDQLSGRWNDSLLQFTARSENDLSEALIAPVDLGNRDGKDAVFDATIQLNGSQQISFTPVGKTTAVSLKSTYPHPSFIGNSLPQDWKVMNSGFTATWKSNAQKLLQPQQFKEPDMAATEVFRETDNSFGVSLYVPVNAYQKTMRSVKYAVLCIVLTFAAFFLIEMVNKRSVHPFQYGLIGLALVLFYSLLLSFSEYIGFNLSYAISSVATIGLIAWFVRGILSSGRLSLVLSMILLLMYAYIFTILQLSDFALLLGSIGLFLTLAVIMHYSKKIQW